MKKIFFSMISLLTAFALTACGTPKGEIPGNASDSSGTETLETKASETEPATEQATEASQNENSGSGKKVLVVYFSATGNTREAAEYIASAAGGDLFELVPETPYSAGDLNWTDENSRVVHEHNDPGAREVALESETVDNFDEYDTVFIGYPIWWGIAAWPVDGFIKANDFTGKTVIPFCTSASSGMGESGELLKEAAGTGNWLEGVRFSSAVSEEDVIDWVKSLGY